jgi:hypothetical protein
MRMFVEVCVLGPPAGLVCTVLPILRREAGDGGCIYGGVLPVRLRSITSYLRISVRHRGVVVHVRRGDSTPEEYVTRVEVIAGTGCRNVVQRGGNRDLDGTRRSIGRSRISQVGRFRRKTELRVLRVSYFLFFPRRVSCGWDSLEEEKRI